MGGELLKEEIENIPEMYKKIFVESGTYKGDSAYLAKNYFNKVITIEICQELFNESSSRLKDFSNVECIFGDSVQVLKQEHVYEQYKKGGVFFLDGHISGHDSSFSSDYPVPLLNELRVLSSKPLGPSLIIIDDVRLWSQGHWNDVNKKNIIECFKPLDVKCAYVLNDRYWIYTNEIFDYHSSPESE